MNISNFQKTDKEIKGYLLIKTNQMRETLKKKLIRKIENVEDDPLGDSLYLRPYKKDLEIINEISRVSNKKKSEIAQKLLRLALRGKKFEFSSEKDEVKKLDWLIFNEKHKIAERDVFAARLERLEEHARELEKTTKQTEENSHIIKMILTEIYCISVVCMSYLNQIFTKIIEYFSPVEIERKNSSSLANQNVLGLIEHSLAELEKLSEYYDFNLEILEPEELYLFTKIEIIKERTSTYIQSGEKVE